MNGSEPRPGEPWPRSAWRRGQFGAGRLAAVEAQVGLGEHQLGAGRQPPVDQVEVVGGLVYQQPARLVLAAVPAAEVVRAVDGVQRPLEVHGGDIADPAVRDGLPYRRVTGGVAVVEGDDELPGVALGGVGDPLAALGVDRQRLLHHHVAAGVQRGAE